jgi:hypothetical protein
MHEVHGMRRPVLFLVAVAMTAVLLARSAAPVAHACSPIDDPPHPLDAHEIVVEGRVTKWERFDAAPLDFGGVPIQITVDIDEVYKGADDSTVTFIDFWSLKPGVEEDWGIVGPCGPAGFFSDPTGDYVVIGLNPGGPTTGLTDAYIGHWVEGERFFVGREPTGEVYELALARLERPGGGGTPIAAVAVSVVALGVAVAFAAMVIKRRRAAP